MQWRRVGAQTRAVAERRLAGVARQWTPGSSDIGVSETAEWPAVRTGPWHRSALRGLALLVAAAVAVVGYTAWLSRPRAIAEAPTIVATGVPLPEAPASAAPADTAGPANPPDPAPDVVVHVTGQVGQPGLVRLPAGSRVADAIEAAGGLTRARAADTVNLARVLTDGEQVLVGIESPTPGGVGPTGSPTPTVLDLNTSTAEQLDALPGVGPVIAGRIVAWRATNGPFRSVEELGEVAGIGESILGQVRGLVRV